MALDSTLGGSTADTYVTLVEADAFFAGHYSLAKGTAWNALSIAQKESVLRRACQIIDALRVLDDEIGYGPLPAALVVYDYHDLILHRLFSYQKLNFPRNIDVDSLLVGFIPVNVKDAQCEQASHLLAFDESAISASLAGISQEIVRAGPVMTSVTYKMGGTTGTMLAPMAFELLRQYIRSTGRMKRA